MGPPPPRDTGGGASTRPGVLRRVSSLPFQKLNDETLVVDPRTRQVHLLNPTATRVWELLEAPRTPDALLGLLTEEFEAGADALRADVEALLADLSAKGLIGADARDEPEGER
jgi:PqqD family protein of HPr-rel-A system